MLGPGHLGVGLSFLVPAIPRGTEEVAELLELSAEPGQHPEACTPAHLRSQ